MIFKTLHIYIHIYISNIQYYVYMLIVKHSNSIEIFQIKGEHLP